jgi:pimeloyl-ACP methyl ester carboxylesterase
MKAPLLFALALAACAPAFAADPVAAPNRFAASIVPAECFEVAVAGATFETARNALQQLIATRKLDKPVLIGHSMGGALASGSPDLVGGVVAVDGLPVLPGTEGMAGPIFATGQQQYMRTIGVVDMARADELAKLALFDQPRQVSDAVGRFLKSL